ncbi:hypothetical protein PIROE2DRAFT_8852 [Piromyces sp. E2]|nr:hypothetical protein PIROE2DRAFT_8852 [Piromyces sp. E2]|eukprot:OUM64380.1 hypothetical protein PIROE2DRAFT_8852 [Piromyces sp. E2]
MQENTSKHSSYLSKQIKFRNLSMEIQKSLKSKKYISLEAYRYLLSAKVLDQLKDFTIQPNYECLCRSLAKYAKTTQQMKLLWSTILLKVNGQLDMITTTYVGKVWKELCYDSRYSHICHFEDDIVNKVDLYFKNRSKQLRKRQINQYTNNYTDIYTTSNNIIYPQSNVSEINNYYITPINSPQFTNQTIPNQINNRIINEVVSFSIPLSPISQYSFTEEDDIISSIFSLSNENSNSTIESLNYCNIYSSPH